MPAQKHYFQQHIASLQFILKQQNPPQKNQSQNGHQQ